MVIGRYLQKASIPLRDGPQPPPKNKGRRHAAYLTFRQCLLHQRQRLCKVVLGDLLSEVVEGALCGRGVASTLQHMDSRRSIATAGSGRRAGLQAGLRTSISTRSPICTAE